MRPIKFLQPSTLHVIGLVCVLLCSSCQKSYELFDPHICYYPNSCLIESRPSAFAPLTHDERNTDWGKELRLAYAFGKEGDYYRAITAFKSALVFVSSENEDRKWQIEYGIVQCYYLASKYQEAVEAFEASTLIYAPNQFSAFHDLLIMLYESYLKADRPEKACNIFGLMNNKFPEEASLLKLSTAFLTADLPEITQLSANLPIQEDVYNFIDEYCSASKSEQRAQLYQALLPGAGYYYVGQKDAARTSFIINLLFTWAAYQFFDHGYVAAGLITASLEAGWYLGGINGARLAAKEYNERMYGLNGCEFMRGHQLFPILMLETTF